MNEEFLHYLWQFKLYKPGVYSTTGGVPLEVVHPGLPNTDAGPDFFNAKLKIDGTLWAGNVEIHTKASDWFRHNHHTDPAYNNVILHVVQEADQEITGANGVSIPAWEMPFEPALKTRYESLIKHKGWIPCENHINKLPLFDVYSWIDRMLIEKLEKKVGAIQELLKNFNNDWEEVFYITLVRNFGFGLNGEPFERMARQTPWKIVLHGADDLIRLEALFLGQAGFLDGLLHDDAYINLLAREYHHLRKKYALTPMPVHLWKFLRLRPVNFPTIRLVQLAALFSKNQKLFPALMEAESLKAINLLLQAEPSEYWFRHYRPGALGKEGSKKLGDHSRRLIVINTVVPLLFARARLRDKPSFQQKAFDWLAEMPPEKNSIIDGWAKKGIGVQARTAGESQALVYLKKYYCNHHKCLACSIGHKLVAGNRS